MADLPTAIARLIAEFSKSQDAVFSPRDALEEVWDALEQLDIDPTAAKQLSEQIDKAKAAGQPHLNGTPLYLLEAMLHWDNDLGGQRHD